MLLEHFEEAKKRDLPEDRLLQLVRVLVDLRCLPVHNWKPGSVPAAAIPAMALGDLMDVLKQMGRAGEEAVDERQLLVMFLSHFIYLSACTYRHLNWRTKADSHSWKLACSKVIDSY